MTALALALGLVQGGVGVPDEFGPALAHPLQDHNPDARVLLDLGPREGERLGEHAQETVGHLLGLSRGRQFRGQVEELVAPEATQRVRGASHFLKAAGERLKQLVAWPERGGHGHEKAQYYDALMRGRLAGAIAWRASTLSLYQQCFGLWRGALFTLLVNLPGGHFRNRTVKAFVPGSRRSLLVRLGTSDVLVFKNIFYDEEYEWHFTDPPRVVVDAGGYTGLSAAWFAGRYSDAKIIAIEPSTSNFDLLRRNTAGLPNILPRHAALWGSSGSVGLTDPGLDAWGFRVRQPEGESHEAQDLLTTEQVDALTGEDVFREYSIDRIDLLKLDIEGSEVEVFASPSGWIKGVDAICLELHDRFRPGCSRAFFAAVGGLAIEVWHSESVLVVRDEKQLKAPKSGTASRSGRPERLPRP